MDYWDELLTNKFLEYSKKDGIYCDVGSANGFFTNVFKNLINEYGYVYGFEPNPYNFDSIKYLNDENCKIENLAISDKVGEMDLYGLNTHSQNYTSNITGYDMGLKPLPIIGKTKTTTLDIYFDDKKVDFLKIDVEGAELDVIRGGLITIKNSILTIIEVHFDRDWEEICNLLDSNGLQFFNLENNEPIIFNNELPSKGRCYQIFYKNFK